jgi:NADH dehydrogenase
VGDSEFNVVTGAFSFTGRHIAERLLVAGKRVRTLTGHVGGVDVFGGRVEAFPFDFDEPGRLVERLRGAATFYNTYWNRFPRKGVGYEGAVRDIGMLVAAAREAGVRRFVHISVANPSEDSPLSYFRGKAAAEELVKGSGMSYAIVRPTAVFGPDDVFINNIAWMLKRFPVFGVAGSGEYRVQPVFVGDVAELCVEAGGKTENLVVDAAGPEIYAFNDLIRLIKESVGSKAAVVHLPAGLALFASKVVGWLAKDVVITKEEMDGMVGGITVSNEPPVCPTRLSEWIARNAQTLGRRYASELGRHYRDG